MASPGAAMCDSTPLHNESARPKNVLFASAFVSRPWCHFIRISKNCQRNAAPELLFSSETSSFARG